MESFDRRLCRWTGRLALIISIVLGLLVLATPAMPRVHDVRGGNPNRDEKLQTWSCYTCTPGQIHCNGCEQQVWARSTKPGSTHLSDTIYDCGKVKMDGLCYESSFPNELPVCKQTMQTTNTQCNKIQYVKPQP